MACNTPTFEAFPLSVTHDAEKINPNLDFLDTIVAPFGQQEQSTALVGQGNDISAEHTVYPKRIFEQPIYPTCGANEVLTDSSISLSPSAMTKIQNQQN